jgi:hypothetical protein
MLNKYDYEKLLHDLKRISRCVKLVRDEISEDKRNIILELLSNEVDRLHSDLEEVRGQDNVG